MGITYGCPDSEGRRETEKKGPGGTEKMDISKKEKTWGKNVCVYKDYHE
jgi:hypothetical protein